MCVWMIVCFSTFTMTSLLPSASTCSASQFLKVYEDEFIDVVYAKQSLLKLKHKGVYCEVAIAADGFPRMQELERKMMETLSLGGWLELCSGCRHGLVCVRGVCVCLLLATS